MKQFTFICILTFIVVMLGCDRDRDELIISYMPVDFQIHISDIDKELKEITRFHEHSGGQHVDINPKYYAVTILVRGLLGGCLGYHQTRIFYNSNNNEIEADLSTWRNTLHTWMPGDTLRIEITESEPKPDGSFDCPTYVYDWYQAIFIGFFVPGEYTIVINDLSETFTIDASRETTPIHQMPCQTNSDYECGFILVQYDEETWQKHTSPIPHVQNFLISKGYKPTITDTFDDLRAEVIYIGNYNVLPVIAEITTLPGVLFVQPSYDIQ